MEYSVFIIFLLLLIIVVVLILIKNPSIAKKDSKPANQGSEKPVPADRICETCNQPIPKERLAIVPDSVLCFSCQTIAEKKQSATSPELTTDNISDYEQNHFDPYDDLEDNNSTDADKINYFSRGLEAYKRGDYIEARKSFELSGDYYYLGLIYENGFGVNIDYQEAAKYYWKASNTGSMADAQIRLGRMYQDGRGVKKSYSGALKWYDKAKENCKEHEQDEILGLIASNIKDMEKEDKSLQPEIKIEFYDQRNYELDILSVAAGKTKDLIDRYHIHSCPNYYAYKRTKYITFRAGDTGEMDALYEIKKILIIPIDARDNLDILESHGLTSNEVQRLTSYMKKNLFPDNYRYYILSRAKDLPDKPRPTEVNAKTIYYSLSQLGTNIDPKKKLSDGDSLREAELLVMLKGFLLKHGVDVTLFSDECIIEIYNAIYNSRHGIDNDGPFSVKTAFEKIANHMNGKKLLDVNSYYSRILKNHGIVNKVKWFPTK
jgi:hypothetical protein